MHLRTTEQAFGERLHTYTIVDAISDKNVLPFRIDYVNTIKLPEGLTDKQVSAIDTEKALIAPERLRQVVAYILEHFDQKTKRGSSYVHSLIANVSEVAGGRNRIEAIKATKRVNGFNALFATASIEAAKRYYAEFKEQQKELPPDRQIKVGLIFSYAANEPVEDGALEEEGFETGALDASSRDFLDHGDQGLQRILRHELRHLGRQVPELLQRSVAADEEPRDRSGDRGQYVLDRIRRHDVEHAVRRQEPPRARTHPGLLADQPHPELRQNLRQHRQLP